MSMDYKGIHQRELFSAFRETIISVPESSRYRILSENLPWSSLAEIAERNISKKININLGRKLNLRMHLGIHIAQAMNGWTDRMSEEMVRYHAGVRVLCGIEGSDETTDHSSIVTFRQSLGEQGEEEINAQVVLFASQMGFTSGKLCSADTTVQESPIRYPTEVGHLKILKDKLLGIGKILSKGTKEVALKIGKKVDEIFTEIRLFTKGKKKKIMEKKKKLSSDLHKEVKRLADLIKKTVSTSKNSVQKKHADFLKLAETILTQTKHWFQTGKHLTGKILSLWDTEAKAYSKDKARSAVEFGRKFFVTLLEGGYVIGGKTLSHDLRVSQDVLAQFLNIFGSLPQMYVFDRGGHCEEGVDFLENIGIEKVAIFPKGKSKMKVCEKDFSQVKKLRATSEAVIATAKTNRYGFNRPRAKTMESCVQKGQMAFLGMNITRLAKDIANMKGMDGDWIQTY